MKKEMIMCAFLALSLVGCAKKESNEMCVRECVVDVSHAPQGPTVRVLVLQDVEGALVEVKGSYNVYDPATGNKKDTAFLQKAAYMHTTTDGIKWGAEYPGVFQLLVVPDHPNSSILVQGVEYKGMIYAYQVDGALAFVNELSVNDYANSLVSDVTAKKKLDREAIAALAIAARGDGFFAARHPKSKYWDVKASDIGYRGASICRIEPEFVAVMEETKGMILRADKPIGWFHDKSTPVDAVAKQAEEGRHARAILGKFFPNAEITLTTSAK